METTSSGPNRLKVCIESTSICTETTCIETTGNRVLQSSDWSKIRVAQHWGRRGANLSENEDVRSECKKFGENSRQMAPVSTICDEYCS